MAHRPLLLLGCAEADQHQVRAGRGDSGDDPAMGVVLSLALSALSAAAGGHFGAKNRARRDLRR